MALVVLSGKITFSSTLRITRTSFGHHWRLLEKRFSSVDAYTYYIYRALPIGHDSSVANQTSRIALLNDPALVTQAVIHTTIALLIIRK